MLLDLVALHGLATSFSVTSNIYDERISHYGMKNVLFLLLLLVLLLCASIDGAAAVLCSEPLSEIQNGKFPATCQNSEPGTVCQAVCDQG